MPRNTVGARALAVVLAALVGETAALSRSIVRTIGTRTKLLKKSRPLTMCVEGTRNEKDDPYTNLKVFEYTDLLEYYNQTKEFLRLPGDGNTTDLNVEDTISSLSALSTKEQSCDENERETSNDDRIFSLQFLEPRHRKSMMRCVLNHHYWGDTIDKSKARSRDVVTKTDFQRRLRLVERRKRWKMTRRLLLGDENDGEGNLWWETGVIRDESAPEFMPGIEEFRNHGSVNRFCYETPKQKIEEPKKFLSRLARGRKYKGDFRSLLEDYVATAEGIPNDVNGDDLIALYDEIIDDSSKSKPKSGDNNYELSLLRLFVDELEETFNNNNNDDRHNPNMEASALIVDAKQINLLRAICDLDIFSYSPPPSKSSNFTAFDDGRSVGKRGERDLEAFLLERSKTPQNTGIRQPFLSPRVLSPVWVRPQSKNRRNLKDKCRYVLEIPTPPTNKAASAISLGTTSEYDAMVVDVVNGNGKDKDTKSNGEIQRHIMVIREVWDAKATLDPSALLDVLEKKVLSLQKLLFDPSYRVANLNDDHNEVETGDNGMTVSMEDVANFSIVAIENDEETSAVHSSSPMLYRVGIETMCTNPENHDSETDAVQNSFPRVGIFASRMINPQAAAKRIQTIVYERLLETDLETVANVVCCNSRSGKKLSFSQKQINPSRINILVRDHSIEMVERILRSIVATRPTVVIGILS